jgi:hypothetical protein
MDATIEVEPTLHASHGPCPHCGGEQQSVWGWIHATSGPTRALYYIRWTAGSADHGMTWLVCVGAWDDEAAEQQRRSVGLRARIQSGLPGFMVIDAIETPWACTEPSALGALLPRSQVVNTSLATAVFAYVDKILDGDPRVARFVETGEGMDGFGAPPTKPL